MTHPYYHATSSAKVFGGDAQDYLEVHRLMDSSKASFCDYRHRIMWHHQEGAEWVADRLGATLIANGVLQSTRLVAEQHILEDCGGTIPTIQDWMDCIPVATWMSNPKPTQAHNEACAARFGGQAADYQAVNEWIDGLNNQNDCRWQLFRHHAEGLFEAEERFGVTILNSRGRKIPTRYIAEEHMTGDFGKSVPSLADWLKPMRRQPWMARVHKVA